MIDYRAGTWGFHVSLGWTGSLVPRALVMALPNAMLTIIISRVFAGHDEEIEKKHEYAGLVIVSLTTVMTFILYNRSRTSYNRWWEGGTLIQKTRGEWFNAFSSVMAFTSTDPKKKHETDQYTQLLARLFSLLMCCGLQQVSPIRDRPFPIIDLEGIEPASMEFLNRAPDKVEIILQWIQRSMILNMQTGVLTAPPPILSRAFQEVSRGIVNLQNARKIADFPYPFPLAQISMILQLIHWAVTPVFAPYAMPEHYAVLYSFISIFVLWCIHFNALDLEFPFGDRVNDLPMLEFQRDWNNSVCTLLDDMAARPPKFQYDPTMRNDIKVAMSDASPLYVPQTVESKGVAQIRMAESHMKKVPTLTHVLRASQMPIGADEATFSIAPRDMMGTQPMVPTLSEAPKQSITSKVGGGPEVSTASTTAAGSRTGAIRISSDGRPGNSSAPSNGVLAPGVSPGDRPAQIGQERAGPTNETATSSITAQQLGSSTNESQGGAPTQTLISTI